MSSIPQSVMETQPESEDMYKIEFKSDNGYTAQAFMQKDGQEKQKLTGYQREVGMFIKAVIHSNPESDISASDNRLKPEKNPFLDHEDDEFMKDGLLKALNHRGSGDMAENNEGNNKEFKKIHTDHLVAAKDKNINKKEDINTAFDAADFDGEMPELKSELSSSVQRIGTEQDVSSGDHKRNISPVCETQEFDRRMIEEVEHALGYKHKNKKDRTGFDHRYSASEGLQEVHKDGDRNDTCLQDLLPGKTLCSLTQELDANSFISIRNNKAYYGKLSMIFVYFWNYIIILPRLLYIGGHAALTDGPTNVSNESAQVISTEHKQMALMQRNIQDFKEQQKPDFKSKISQTQDDLLDTYSRSDHVVSGKMNVLTSKRWNKGPNLARFGPHSYRENGMLNEMLATELKEYVQFIREYESKFLNRISSIINGKWLKTFLVKEHGIAFCLEDCKQRHVQNHLLTNIHIDDKYVSYIRHLNYSTDYICPRNSIWAFVVALEPRLFNTQNEVNIPVMEHSSPPTRVEHHVPRHVEGENVLIAGSQILDGQPIGRGSSRGMDGRLNDPTNSPAIPCNNSDTGFTDIQLASGRVTEDASQDSIPTLLSAAVHASSGQCIGERGTMLEARSQHSNGDTRCRDVDNGNRLQTDAGCYDLDLSQLPITEQAADGNPFHRAATRSTQNEHPSVVSGINNKPDSPVNSHKKRSDTRSAELQTMRSTDPGNGSTMEQTYTVHLPTRTSNQDDSSANLEEMASLNLASGGINNTRGEASGRGQNENRGDATSIQETDSAQPKYPQYASRDQRMNSFQRWPARLRQRPEEMAECGFYFAGFNDLVHCFHCGVGLRCWMHEDDPWFEHARWSPSCFHVCKIKGNDFVSVVQSAIRIAEMEGARKNATGNDSGNNRKESADGKNKDTNNETEETAMEHEPSMNPDIFPEVMRQFHELYDSTICMICLDRKRSVVFLPCSHFGTCTRCSYFLQECPFCRRLIEEKIEITDC